MFEYTYVQLPSKVPPENIFRATTNRWAAHIITMLALPFFSRCPIFARAQFGQYRMGAVGNPTCGGHPSTHAHRCHCCKKTIVPSARVFSHIAPQASSFLVICPFLDACSAVDLRHTCGVYNFFLGTCRRWFGSCIVGHSPHIADSTSWADSALDRGCLLRLVFDDGAPAHGYVNQTVVRAVGRVVKCIGAVALTLASRQTQDPRTQCRAPALLFRES